MRKGCMVRMSLELMTLALLAPRSADCKHSINIHFLKGRRKGKEVATKLSISALNAVKRGNKIDLPIFSERTALLLKEQISTFDKCHIIAISSAVENVFLGIKLGSINRAKTPDLAGMKSLTKKILKNVLLE